MGWLTDNPEFRKALWFIAVVLDLFLSYMWWLSLTTSDVTLKKILWAMCALYMFYAIPSAVMYFNNEMVRKDTVITNNQFEISAIKDRLTQIKNELDSIATYKNTESKTGYRARSQAVKDDKDSLVNEQKEKLVALKELTKENTANGASNPFKGNEWFMGLIVGITVIMFYFGQFLIMWDITRKLTEKGNNAGTQEDKPSCKGSLSEDDKIIPQNEIIPDIPKEIPSEQSPAPIETPNLTDKQQKMIHIVNSLYDVESDTDPPKELKKIPQAHRDIMHLGVTWREFQAYKKELERIGAISFISGKNGEGVWKKERVLNYIQKEVV